MKDVGRRVHQRPREVPPELQQPPLGDGRILFDVDQFADVCQQRWVVVDAVCHELADARREHVDGAVDEVHDPAVVPLFGEDLVEAAADGGVLRPARGVDVVVVAKQRAEHPLLARTQHVALVAVRGQRLPLHPALLLEVARDDALHGHVLGAAALAALLDTVLGDGLHDGQLHGGQRREEGRGLDVDVQLGVQQLGAAHRRRPQHACGHVLRSAVDVERGVEQDRHDGRPTPILPPLVLLHLLVQRPEIDPHAVGGRDPEPTRQLLRPQQHGPSRQPVQQQAVGRDELADQVGLLRLRRLRLRQPLLRLCNTETETNGQYCFFSSSSSHSTRSG